MAQLPDALAAALKTKAVEHAFVVEAVDDGTSAGCRYAVDETFPGCSRTGAVLAPAGAASAPELFSNFHHCFAATCTEVKVHLEIGSEKLGDRAMKVLLSSHVFGRETGPLGGGSGRRAAATADEPAAPEETCPDLRDVLPSALRAVLPVFLGRPKIG
jgi:hypothetical protein